MTHRSVRSVTDDGAAERKAPSHPGVLYQPLGSTVEENVRAESAAVDLRCGQLRREPLERRRGEQMKRRGVVMGHGVFARDAKLVLVAIAQKRVELRVVGCELATVGKRHERLLSCKTCTELEEPRRDGGSGVTSFRFRAFPGGRSRHRAGYRRRRAPRLRPRPSLRRAAISPDTARARRRLRPRSVPLLVRGFTRLIGAKSRL